jgi:hypothetical protein
LAACQTPGGAASVQEAVSASGGSNWNLDDADALSNRFKRDMRRLLVGRELDGALQELRSAGFECATGEGHEDHPDPMSVCTKSFATRACQLDWSVDLAPRNAVIDSVDTVFTRDCVGVDRDFPEEKRSAIDDQLAPARP